MYPGTREQRWASEKTRAPSLAVAGAILLIVVAVPLSLPPPALAATTGRDTRHGRGRSATHRGPRLGRIRVCPLASGATGRTTPGFAIGARRRARASRLRR